MRRSRTVHTMFRALVLFLTLFVASFAVASFAKPMDNAEWKTEVNGNNGIDIEKVATREYESVHGRILAVNQAHIHKRAAQTNSGGAGNAFTKIENANKANMTNLYQGDIIRDDFLESDFSGKARNALRWRKRLWTSRVIPYVVPGKMSHIKANLLKAIAQIERNTCLRIVPYNWRVHKNYVEFTDTNGCSSKVGKKYYEPGRQTISLGKGCNFPSTILHELMHTIGFFHEQARWDRNKYVKIYWENILDGFSDQFDKYDWRDIDDLGSSYDYKSVMHYDRKAFTKNGKPTIVAIGNENMAFKMPDMMLSPRDIVEINVLYDCKTTRYGWTQWASWTPCDQNCYRTRERYCYNNGDVKACKSSHIMNVYGVDRQKEKCAKSICPAPVDGNWGRWAEWQACDVTCNDGYRTRTRKCTNPSPAHGGKVCAGESNERKICTRKRCQLDPDDTDFENYRLGMWSQSTNDKLNWNFHKGPTQTVNTGPMTDHTTGGWQGYYLYVESSGAQGGANAKLVSPWKRPTSNVRQCLKFHYSMYGSNTGSLSVQIELKGKVNSKYLIFYKKGDQGRDWKSAAGNIDIDVGSSYQLTFEGKVGSGYSDIAIDDVYVDAGLCKCQDEYVTCSGKWRRDYGCQSTWMRTNCKRTCQSCQVDGGWGAWSSWNPCSVTCGAGTRTRARTCDSPASSNGGRACAGQGTETQQCNAAAACPPAPCQDKKKVSCPIWAKAGECKKNPTYMKVNCAKSCNTCPTPSCQDKNVNCPGWAKVGECKKNPTYMTVNCAKSCNTCCIDDNVNCPAWAKSKECDKNPSWMLKNCKKSCKQC